MATKALFRVDCEFTAEEDSELTVSEGDMVRQAGEEGRVELCMCTSDRVDSPQHSQPTPDDTGERDGWILVEKVDNPSLVGFVPTGMCTAL